eukprot:PhM_4_TR9235/c2_g1_i1/m.72566/K00428/E1.11.1.5; cytochrome c peroxidase
MSRSARRVAWRDHFVAYGTTLSMIAGSCVVLFGSTMVHGWYLAGTGEHTGILTKKVRRLLSNDRDLCWRMCHLAVWHSMNSDRFDSSVRFRSAPPHLKPAVVFLEQMCETYEKMNAADLFAIIACVSLQEVGGPSIKPRIGRDDTAGVNTQIPFPEDGALDTVPKLRSAYRECGIGDADFVALMGLRTIGRFGPDCQFCRTATPEIFTNEYFIRLNEGNWRPTSLSIPLSMNSSSSSSSSWFSRSGAKKKSVLFSDQNTNSDSGNSIYMMCDDVALKHEGITSGWVKKYARDERAFFVTFSNVFTNLLEKGHNPDTLRAQAV